MLEIFHSNMSTYNRKDHFYHKAKKEGYASRAAYKIVEMDKKFGIFKPNAKIVDLGCTPGGWLQVAEEKCASALVPGAIEKKPNLPNALTHHRTNAPSHEL